jgi:hypothetical protein
VIARWVKIATDYPEVTVGKSRLEILLDAVRKRPQKLTDEEFAPMKSALTNAAQSGVLGAMMLLGDNEYKSQPADAFHWYTQAADSKYPPAYGKVGLMYSNGAGTALDISKAIEYFKLGADAGDAAAQFSLGECYLRSNGVALDEKRAIELLNLSADQSNSRALNLLGVCYNQGIAVPKNQSKAFDLFSQAAARGLAEAYGNLGVMYILGHGATKDESRAARLFQTGADKGDAFCMFLLAQCLEEGTGTAQAPADAQSWYRKSALIGYPRAKDWCAQHGVALDGK